MLYTLENFFNNGLKWLAKQQDRCAAVPVVYKTENGAANIRAVIGKTSQDVISQREVDVGSAYFDFIVERRFLTEEPKAGHIIISGDQFFEVVNQIDGRCYSIVDSTFDVLRIHTQLV